jgi:hypothetical protein
VKNKKIYFAISALAVATLSLPGCGHKDPVEAVKQRADERWKLLVDHHAVQAYEYLSPGFRSTHTLEQYVGFVASSHVQWQSAKVETPVCDDDVCTVRIFVTSIVPGRFTGLARDITHEAPIMERWVASDGQWYFLPDSNIKIDTSQSLGADDKPGRAPGSAIPSLAPGMPAPKPATLPPAPGTAPPATAPAHPADGN